MLYNLRLGWPLPTASENGSIHGAAFIVDGIVIALVADNIGADALVDIVCENRDPACGFLGLG